MTPEPDQRVERHHPERVPGNPAAVDHRMAARVVADILHKRFAFPEKLFANVEAVSVEIASAMLVSVTQANRLYWEKTHGTA